MSNKQAENTLPPTKSNGTNTGIVDFSHARRKLEETGIVYFEKIKLTSDATDEDRAILRELVGEALEYVKVQDRAEESGDILVSFFGKDDIEAKNVFVRWGEINEVETGELWENAVESD